MRTVACMLVVAVLTTLAFGQATVTVNPANQYQTIEGFGAHGGASVWWQGGPFYSEAFGNVVVGDMGLTMIRNEFYPDFEATNENSDPNSLDMQAFNYAGIFGSKQKNYIISMRDKAASLGEPLRWITSYWTPPAWMKTNNSEINGGELKAAAREEFAEFAVATVRAYKEQCGIDLYAMSIQNEPAFEEPYNSCVYTPEQYRDAVKVVGPKLHGVYPDVKLFGAEDMLANWTRNAYGGEIQQDPISREHHNVFAVHGYSDGVHPTPASDAVLKWSSASKNCTAAGKALWMTETSGYTESWDDCFHLAEMLYASLKYGKLSAWVWWQLGGSCDYNALVTTAGQYCRRGYIHKHYARYIRPGAVMVDAISTSELLFSVAFYHPNQQTLTVVLLNAGDSRMSVSLDGPSLPASLDVYRSTDSENCASQGALSTSGSLTIPARSLVTLYGDGYTPSSVERLHAQQRRPHLLSGAPTAAFDLRGRRLSAAVHTLAGGVTVLQRSHSGSVMTFPVR